jgi:hypothetical protein
MECRQDAPFNASAQRKGKAKSQNDVAKMQVVKAARRCPHSAQVMGSVLGRNERLE